jgi:hypothetical protein
MIAAFTGFHDWFLHVRCLSDAALGQAVRDCGRSGRTPRERYGEDGEVHPDGPGVVSRRLTMVAPFVGSATRAAASGTRTWAISSGAGSQIVDIDGRCDGLVAGVVGVEVVAGVVAGVELLRVGGVGDGGGEVGDGVVFA